MKRVRLCDDRTPERILAMWPKSTTVDCSARQDLLLHEQLLRSDSKLEIDWQRAAALADAAIKVQKARFQHELNCEICRRQTRTEGAAAA